MMKTLYVENRAQAAIFEMEMKGQLSDGRWENSLPHNHWKTPVEAYVVVRPNNTGRDFYHMRGYNFGEKELFEIVGERMTRYAQAAIAFPNVSIQDLNEHSWTFDSPLTNAVVLHRDNVQKLLELVGVATPEEFEAKLAATGYTTKRAKADATGLTRCFRKTVVFHSTPQPLRIVENKVEEQKVEEIEPPIFSP